MFAIRDLSVATYTNGFTQWHYKAGDDSWVRLLAPAYFRDASDMIKRGDMILVSGEKIGGILYVIADHPPLCIVIGAPWEDARSTGEFERVNET